MESAQGGDAGILRNAAARRLPAVGRNSPFAQVVGALGALSDESATVDANESRAARGLKMVRQAVT